MKKLILGLVIGLMMGTATTVFAATGSITATFQTFNFLVNGTSKTPDSTPLVYNGTSYLPVRSIANMLGYDVTYKNDTNTIEFTNSSGSVVNNVSTPAEIQQQLIQNSIKNTQDDLTVDKNQLASYQQKLTDTTNWIKSQGGTDADVNSDLMIKSYQKAIAYYQSQISTLTTQLSNLQAQLTP